MTSNDIHPGLEGGSDDENHSTYERGADDDAPSLREWAGNGGSYTALEEMISEDLYDVKTNYVELYSDDFSVNKSFSRSESYGQTPSGPKVLFLQKSNKNDPMRLENQRRYRYDYYKSPKWLSVLLLGSGSSPFKETNLARMKSGHYGKKFGSSPTINSVSEKRDGVLVGGDGKGFWKIFKALGCVGFSRNMATDASMGSV